MKKNINVVLTASIILLAVFTSIYSYAAPKKRILKVDIKSSTEELSKMPLVCIGAGRAHEGLMGDWQRQLIEVQKECNFKYIRFHGLFSDDMGVFKIYDGKVHYNFMYVDALYDFLLSIHIRPFVELGFMPEALASGKKTIFWWKGNVTLPSSFDEYSKFIKAFAQHLTKRYGENEIKKWYFEVWNEPNLSAFFDAKQADYFKLYKVASESIKSVNVDYRVGGPATAGLAWVPEFINFTKENKVPLDFITTHAYGVEGALDEYGTQDNFLVKNPLCIPDGLAETRKQIIDAGEKDMELHITEFNSSYSPADPIHDTYQNATYLLNVLKNSIGHVTSMSYWTFTDIFEEPGTVDKPFHGGFGLISFQNIRKPSFYAYSFYNKLFKNKLSVKDDGKGNDTQDDLLNYWITKNNNNEVSALIYDFTMPHQGKKGNKTYFTQMHPSYTKGVIELELNNMQDGKYILELQSVGYMCHDAQSLYLKMESPQDLTISQEQMLRNAALSYPKSSIAIVKNGKTTIRLNRESNKFYLIKLRKI